jgi:hypothetical protein
MVNTKKSRKAIREDDSINLNDDEKHDKIEEDSEEDDDSSSEKEGLDNSDGDEAR